MKHIVLAAKELQETLEQSNNYSSQMKKGMEDLIAAIVNKNVDYMVYQTNRILSDETTVEQKQKTGSSLNWLFKDMKPFMDTMYSMYPEHKTLFDTRAKKVEDAYQKYIEEKKKSGGYKKSW